MGGGISQSYELLGEVEIIEDTQYALTFEITNGEYDDLIYVLNDVKGCGDIHFTYRFDNSSNIDVNTRVSLNDMAQSCYFRLDRLLSDFMEIKINTKDTNLLNIIKNVFGLSYGDKIKRTRLYVPNTKYFSSGNVKLYGRKRI